MVNTRLNALETVATPPKLYFPRELAQALRVCPETIKRRVRDGKIKAIWAGLGWRIPAEEYNRVLAAGLD